MSSSLRVSALLALALAVGAFASPPAGAAPPLLAPCGEAAPDGLCGAVVVPLDRRDPNGATIPIAIRVYPHTDESQPALDPILASEGGPGYSITQNNADAYASYAFTPLRDRHDLVLIDQRGVGLSNAIDCPSIQHGADDFYAALAACGAQLGATADVYGSGDVALDMEAVRAALGIERFAFYGASYSTVDAQAYAARFPERLSAMVLDSPVEMVHYDSFYTSGAGAIARDVDLLCRRSASCSREHRHASEDLAWLARRLRSQPLDGVGIDSTGEPHQVHVSEGFLANHIGYNDRGTFEGPSEIPAAAQSLRDGDAVPLLRLAADGAGPILGDEGEPTLFSAGLSAARFCTDQTPPWDKNAPLATRRQQWEAARATLAPNLFAPFSVDAWLASPPDGLQPDPCIAWPAPRAGTLPAIPAGAAFPRIPVLVLVGDLDIVTPAADARSVAALFPKSRFVELAGAGHHTIFNWNSSCAVALVQSFLATLKPGDTSCAAHPEITFPVPGRFPLVAKGAVPASVASRKDRSSRLDRKVAAVAAAAVTDAFRSGFMTGADGVGLRGGSFTVAFGDDDATFELDAVRFAGDVAISGRAVRPWETGVIDAVVAVDGPRGEDGNLHITGAWVQAGATTLRIDGKIGKRAVALTVPAT